MCIITIGGTGQWVCAIRIGIQEVNIASSRGSTERDECRGGGRVGGVVGGKAAAGVDGHP